LANQGSGNDATTQTKRSRLRGVVILSRYFQLSLVRFRAFIKETEARPLFKSLKKAKLLNRVPLPLAYVNGSKEVDCHNLIGSFRKEGQGLAV